MCIATLKKRTEFERIRGGGRWSTALFVLEGRPRAVALPVSALASLSSHSGQPADAGPRFGFTISRKVGNAVVRNRIRRRLRAALNETKAHADPRFDYVVVARRPAHDCPYDEMKSSLQVAFTRVHESAAKRPAGRGAQPGKTGRGPRAPRPTDKSSPIKTREPGTHDPST